MRKGIDFIGVGSGAVIINNQGKIFLNKRGPKARNESGKWDFPGGSVEFGEKLEDAIAREIKEEHDFLIEAIELLEVCNHIIPEENQHWVSPTFICKVKAGEPKICELEKCEEIGWFDFDEINRLELTLSSRQNYEALKEKFKDGIPDFYN